MSSSMVRNSTDARTAGHSHLEQAIHNPGSVKIDVRGAYIVDDVEDFADRRGNSDIRLPNHTGIVSHVAVDVSSVPCTNTSIDCALINPVRIDWWFPGEIGLLYARARLCG